METLIGIPDSLGTTGVLSNKTYVRIVYLVVGLVLLLYGGVSQGGESGPQGIVKEYYSMDLDGVRLSGSSWKKVRPLITWDDEPGWDQIYITKDASIHGIKNVSANKTIVEVRYRVIGILSGESLYSFAFNEIVEYVLVKNHDDWKISEPIIPPHVSPTVTLKRIEKSISSRGGTEAAKNLGHAATRLKDLIKSFE